MLTLNASIPSEGNLVALSIPLRTQFTVTLTVNVTCAVVFNQEEELQSVVKANFIVVCGSSLVFTNYERKLTYYDTFKTVSSGLDFVGFLFRRWHEQYDHRH